MDSVGAVMSLQIFVRRVGDVAIVELHGRATDGPANDILHNQLRRVIAGGTSKVLVGLTDVTQIDSSSIGSIVSAFVSLNARGGSLQLLRPRGNVKSVLETVQLLDIIPIIEDETQAITSLD